MLLPALSKAREKARKISCVNQMKQIGLANQMYAQDNDSKLPIGTNIIQGGTIYYPYTAYGEASCSVNMLAPYITKTPESNEAWLKAIKTHFFCPSDSTNHTDLSGTLTNYINISYLFAYETDASANTYGFGKARWDLAKDDPMLINWMDKMERFSPLGTATMDNHGSMPNVLTLSGSVVTINVPSSFGCNTGNWGYTFRDLQQYVQ